MLCQYVVYCVSMAFDGHQAKLQQQQKINTSNTEPVSCTVGYKRLKYEGGKLEAEF